MSWASITGSGCESAAAAEPSSDDEAISICTLGPRLGALVLKQLDDRALLLPRVVCRQLRQDWCGLNQWFCQKLLSFGTKDFAAWIDSGPLLTSLSAATHRERRERYISLYRERRERQESHIQAQKWRLVQLTECMEALAWTEDPGDAREAVLHVLKGLDRLRCGNQLAQERKRLQLTLVRCLRWLTSGEETDAVEFLLGLIKPEVRSPPPALGRWREKGGWLHHPHYQRLVFESLRALGWIARSSDAGLQERVVGVLAGLIEDCVPHDCEASAPGLVSSQHPQETSWVYAQILVEALRALSLIATPSGEAHKAQPAVTAMLQAASGWYYGSVEHYWLLPVHDEGMLAVVCAAARALHRISPGQAEVVLEDTLGRDWWWFVEQDEGMDHEAEYLI